MTHEERMKKELTEAGLRLAKSLGGDVLKVSAICEEAGVSKGTFYKYFKSKEEIFTNIYVSVDPVLLEAMPRILMAEVSPLQKYWRIWRFYIDRTIDVGPQVVEYVARSGFRVSQEHGFFLRENYSIYDTRSLLLEKCQSLGLVRSDVPVKTLIDNFLYYLVGVNIDWSHRRGAFDYMAAAFDGMMMVMCAKPDFGPYDEFI